MKTHLPSVSLPGLIVPQPSATSSSTLGSLFREMSSPEPSCRRAAPAAPEHPPRSAVSGRARPVPGGAGGRGRGARTLEGPRIQMRADSPAIADFLWRLLRDLLESYFVPLPTCERSKIPFSLSPGLGLPKSFLDERHFPNFPVRCPRAECRQILVR